MKRHVIEDESEANKNLFLTRKASKDVRVPIRSPCDRPFRLFNWKELFK